MSMLSYLLIALCVIAFTIFILAKLGVFGYQWMWHDWLWAESKWDRWGKPANKAAHYYKKRFRRPVEIDWKPPRTFERKF